VKTPHCVRKGPAVLRLRMANWAGLYPRRHSARSRARGGFDRRIRFQGKFLNEDLGAPPMGEGHARAPTRGSTRSSRVIRARAEALYAAFLDPIALVDWLPPGEMTGEVHEFDAWIGGGYRRSLFYPRDERAFRGKTSDREDVIDVRFVELAPPHRIVEAVAFVTTDPGFAGEMTLTATFEEVSGGTEVTLAFSNLPRGLRAEDNEEGSRLSLEQLARRFE
jgi:uncharacterized protein YndB with AHSA1/START domain